MQQQEILSKLKEVAEKINIALGPVTLVSRPEYWKGGERSNDWKWRETACFADEEAALKEAVKTVLCDIKTHSFHTFADMSKMQDRGLGPVAIVGPIRASFRENDDDRDIIRIDWMAKAPMSD